MNSVSTPAGIVSFDCARHVVEQHAAQIAPPATETADLLAALERVLAEPILADRDFPPFHRATRDGYAVRAADIAQVPARLEVVGEIKAGDLPDKCDVQAGQAVSIMTGAALPSGADAVAMIEYTKLTGNSVDVLRSLQAGENFVPCGSEARQGKLLLDRGACMDAAAIAVAAAVGKATVQVFRKPQVAVLATGDELVEIHATPGPAQIRNSNTYSLAGQIKQCGGEPILSPIAPDEPKRLRALIEEGLRSDLLLLSGGVSMGKYDLVEQVLSELKAEFYFTGVQIQPGRPVVFGSCEVGIPVPQKRYFFGLPGNPVSTMVTFELFVRPMLEALSGMKSRPLIFSRARLKTELHTKIGLTRFLPALFSGKLDKAEVDLVPWQGSGDIASLTIANCYLVVPPDQAKMEAGEWVSALLR